MTSREHEYETNARAALESARGTLDLATRKHWLNIAGQWIELANAEKQMHADKAAHAEQAVSDLKLSH